MTSRRLRRDPDLVVVWRSGDLVIRNVRTGRSVRGSPGAIALLDAFSRPRRADAVAGDKTPDRRESVLRAVHELERFGLLISARDGVPRDRLKSWNDNVASALYHAAIRDLPYRKSAVEAHAYLRQRHSEAGPPPTFKRYSRRPTVSLDGEQPPATDLAAVLAGRRTVRDFSRLPVPLTALAAIVRGTWGQTGWLDGGDLGRAPTRTSPSGGALHPIECYVLAWRVSELEPGLYHYDVRGNELRRLKSGDLSREAVALASGQRWVGRAAFLCIMTAAFERTLWKYRVENAYRTVWLEAGHFAQTFALLATSYGLGAFTTAAMQDSRIERLIGLDGVREFPVYLCGAGVPGPQRVGPRWTPLRRPQRSTRSPVRRRRRGAPIHRF